MIHHDVTVDIARPVAEVFALLADVARTPAWLSRCVSLTREQTGALAVGDALTYVYREGSRTGTMQGTVAALEANETLEFRYTDKLMHVRVAFDLANAGGRTSLHHAVEIAPQTWPFKLLQPVIRRAVVKQTAADMAKLKALLERS